MATTVMSASFSFLASGPQFSVDIPSYFDPLPELASPLDNGRGARSFVFRPAFADGGITDSLPAWTVTDRDGRLVEVHERIETPPLWWLRWQLSNGALYTHLREEDGSEIAAATAESVSVVETDGAAPFILAYPPLSFAASARPDYAERALFLSPSKGEEFNITLQRPSAFAERQVATVALSNTGGLVVLRVGLRFGLEGLVWAGDDRAAADEIVTGLLNTLREG